MLLGHKDLLIFYFPRNKLEVFLGTETKTIEP